MPIPSIVDSAGDSAANAADSSQVSTMSWWREGFAVVAGLALICMPRVPVENTENDRSSFHSLRILRKFLFARTRPFFLRQSRAIPSSKTALLAVFFLQIKPTPH